MHRCRTRVYEDHFGPKTSIGRGNLSFTTINLPKLAIETAIKDGYIYKNEEGKYVFSEDPALQSLDAMNTRIAHFKKMVKEYVDLAGAQLNERYNFQKQALKKQFPLLMAGMWNGSEKLDDFDQLGDLINHGTLGVGFIGLAEALIALTGKHHGESEQSQAYGLDIIKSMKVETNKLVGKYQHNYSVFATPAEGLSGKFTVVDRKTYGEIPGVTDKEYYTNSNHVPVYYHCTAKHKAEIECPYHKLTTAGHIFYVEADADITKNPEVIDTINKIARENDGGYISINHTQGRCNHCNYESNDPNLEMGSVCPHCGHHSWDVLARVTGYLISTTDRWNNGKLNELTDRVDHKC